MKVLPRLDTLAEGECFEFELADGEPCFGVKFSGRVHAYRNSCPHTGAALNWQPGVFLTPEGDWIQCSLHGALFGIENGKCRYGPCTGEGLIPIDVEECDGFLILPEGREESGLV